MRFIPTWVHGMLDYPLAIVLIALPWLGGFANGGPEQRIPVCAGVAMLGLSAMTAYEAGLVRAIPMTGHLIADGIVGALLAVSPWLFGFAEVVWLPHLILGIGELGAAMTTETRPRHHLGRSAI